MSLKKNQRSNTGASSGVSSAIPVPSPGNPRPSANAWTRPLQQSNSSRSRVTPNGNNVNGLIQGVRSPATNNSGTGNRGHALNDMSGSSKENVSNVLRERFLHLTLSMVGQRVTVTQTNGSVIEGIFHTFTPFDNQPDTKKNIYVIKACKSMKGPNNEESKEEKDEPLERCCATVVTDGCTVLIPSEKVSNLYVKSMRLETTSVVNSKGASTRSTSNGNHQNIDFRTDTEISKGGASTSEELVAAGSAWTSSSERKPSRSLAPPAGLENSPLDSAGRKGLFGTSLSSANPGTAAVGKLTGSIGEWNQFSANEKLTQKKATFDENIYTTELDKSKMDTRKIEEAERLAREIEGTSSSNIHIAEERGHKLEGDYDEEDLYSGVLTSGNRVRVAPLGSALRNDSDQQNIAVDETKAHKKNNDKALSTDSKESAKKDLVAESKPVVPPKKVMNYAAAAVKADAGKSLSSFSSVTSNNISSSELAKSRSKQVNKADALVKPGKNNKETEKNARESNQISNIGADKLPIEAKRNEHLNRKKQTAGSSDEITKKGNSDSIDVEVIKEENEEKTESSTNEKPKVSSKLNANAKSFTFNPSAKSFTPGGAPSESTSSSPAPSSSNPMEQQIGMPVGNTPNMPGMSHYMHHPQMNQPGIMPMMNAHYASNMRYQPPYMMAQHGVQISQQSQQVQSMPNPAPQQSSQLPQAEGQSNNREGQDQTQQKQSQPQPTTIDPNQPQGGKQSQVPSGQQPQQQGVPLAYSMPQSSGYYANGIPMQSHARGPAPNMTYPPIVGTHQQIPVVHGRNPYGMYGAVPTHMQQPGGMPNMSYSQIRGPTGPYYPSTVAPGHYPPSGYSSVGPPHMDDGDQGYRSGRGGRGGARGNSRRNSNRKSGRGNGGRGHYHGSGHYQHAANESQTRSGSVTPSDTGSDSQNKGAETNLMKDESNSKTKAKSKEQNDTAESATSTA